jgi:hypothetical protein
MSVIDVFDGRIELQPGILEAAGERFILAPGPLLIDQQSDTVFKTEAAHFGIFQLSAERLSHTGKFHSDEFFDGGLH